MILTPIQTALKTYGFQPTWETECVHSDGETFEVPVYRVSVLYLLQPLSFRSYAVGNVLHIEATGNFHGKVHRREGALYGIETGTPEDLRPLLEKCIQGVAERIWIEAKP